ncbi:MAG: hypothetical protein ABR595_05995 [Psychroflexus sp.]
MFFNNYIRIILILCLLVSFFSCKDKSETKDKENIEQTQNKSTNLDNELKLDTIQIAELSDEAKNVTKDWMKYIALETEIERFNDYTVQDLVNNAETILKVADSLQQTVPKNLKTNSLEARIRTLYTHARLLEENAKRNKPKAEDIEDLSVKLKRDFNNFNIQINEVFIQQEDSLQTRNQL